MASLVITGGYGGSLIPSGGYGGVAATVAAVLFQLDSVEIQTPSVLRVRFTKPPAIVGANPTIGTFPGNYTLISGTTTITILMASVVSSDDEVIDLYLATPLTPGPWSLTVASTMLGA